MAQLIAYVKVDLVNQIRDSGVKKHGMNITKSRPKEEMLKMEFDGKYVQRRLLWVGKNNYGSQSNPGL